ncbi:unnamed protein product [Caenorhabditis bovis]|uniref:RNA polymerase II-associated factor 1 homolog n=1 Tax=Caenorhabditis bovis TaxID=2654633 RepID=A0A8S1EJ76_9PELO|nr:unnamed protein product [Caenorhabditis bovis]
MAYNPYNGSCSYPQQYPSPYVPPPPPAVIPVAPVAPIVTPAYYPPPQPVITGPPVVIVINPLFLLEQRALSGSPLYEDMITPESKFSGEALEMKDVRTVFVGGTEDDQQRSNRVLLLLGPSSSGKSDLIDFFCNYFYGTDPNSGYRYRIANEKFSDNTPNRPIQCYIFNNTNMAVRPVIIDTPGCGDTINNVEASEFTLSWLVSNWKMRIDAIGVVFSDLYRMSTHEETELQKILTELPNHVSDNIVVFITASDGSRIFEPLIRRFGLSEKKKYTINTSCIFQKPLEDRLNDEHRKRYWKMSTNQFKDFYDYLHTITPVTISGLPYIDDALYGSHYESRRSSSSENTSRSPATVIEAPITTMIPPSIPPKSPSPLKPNIPPPPPPLPASPPPPPTSTIPRRDDSSSFGIPLRDEKRVSATPPPPRPPNFAPPQPPPTNRASVPSGTIALERAMADTTNRTAPAPYDYAYRATDDPGYMQPRDSQLKSQYELRNGILTRRHSVPDDVRHYADEYTPPPVVHDIADRYSTVAYMNQDPYVTKINNIGVRDAYRLSRDGLQIVDKNQSSTTNSPNEELQRMNSGRSATSVKPTSDLASNYVYEERHYSSQSGERQSRSAAQTTDRKRWSKSSDAARSETFFNDPYYTGPDVITGFGTIETRRSKTSLHSFGPELVHSENKYDYQPVNESVYVNKDAFDRSETYRRSRRQSEGSTQIYIDRRISPERQRKDYGFIETKPNPPPPPVVRRINGGEVREEERSVYEAYSQINQNRNRYDQPPTEPYQPNHYIIPNSMRGSGSPIQVRVHLAGKSPECIVRRIHADPYNPYGSIHGRPQEVTEETTTTTTTTRKEEIERKRKKKEEELRRKRLDEQRRREEEERRRRYEEVQRRRQYEYNARGSGLMGWSRRLKVV